MNTPYNINELVARHLAGETLTEEQRVEVKTWTEKNKAEYERLKALVEAARPTEGITFDEERAWKKIEHRLSRHLPARFIKAVFAIAACAIVAFGIFAYRQHQQAAWTVYQNKSAKVEETSLPDGSRITLYPGTTLAYRPDGEDGRTTTLEGKAFFKVKHQDGNPFTVTSGNARIEVVGTAFLVEAPRKAQTRVYVKNGLVKVSTEANEVLLHANEQARIEDNTFTTGRIENAAELFYKGPKTLVFNDTPIETVLSRLEEIYTIQIDIDEELKSNRITTKIKLGKPEDILQELCYLCRCNYKKTGQNHYTLSKQEDE